MKICMVTTRHFPGDPRIFEKESKSLVEAGHEVVILVPEGILPENAEGVQFKTFTKISGPFKKINTIIQTYRLAKDINADVYHCHEIDVSLFIGWLMKIKGKEKNVKLIFDCHEFWLGFFNFRMPFLIRWLFKPIFRFYEKWIVSRCDAIITANSIERAYYQIMFPLKPIVTIYNVPHIPTKQNDENNSNEKKYDISFEGFLNFERGLKQLFNLVLELKNEFPNIRLLIVGKLQGEDSKIWGERFMSENNLETNIEITGWVSYKEIPAFHKKCKIGIFLYNPTPNNLLAGPPNKLFNFMRARLPVVVSNLPETVNIVREIRCGYIVDPESMDEIKNAVIKLLRDENLRKKFGENGYQSILNKYNWESESEKFLMFYDSLYF